jgi:uncharacterized membrane protein YkvA (DUF1232 family)
MHGDFPTFLAEHLLALRYKQLFNILNPVSYPMIAKIKHKARLLKTETYALYLAYKDPRVPWYAKAFAAFIVAHTFSPIDLIPDFIPVIGYLDDLIITPLGIFLALKMIPPEVMGEARQQAKTAELEGRIQSRAGIAIVLTLWAIGSAILALFIYRYFANK